jgi:hypothetical protein
MKGNLKVATNQLLEILHIIVHDGSYNDIEGIEQVLQSIGVSQEVIDYHKK